jgi:hypothetical protein
VRMADPPPGELAEADMKGKHILAKSKNWKR